MISKHMHAYLLAAYFIGLPVACVAFCLAKYEMDPNFKKIVPPHDKYADYDCPTDRKLVFVPKAVAAPVPFPAPDFALCEKPTTSLQWLPDRIPALRKPAIGN